MRYKCPDCKSKDVTEYTPGIFGDSRHRCNSCGKISVTADFVEPTVFDRIAASPEALAPHFVYHVTSFLDGLDKPKKVWYSTLINNQYFNTELEAKRATVARLKEVAQ